MFLKKIINFFLTTKSWKNHPQKLLRIPQIHFFFLTALTAQTTQTEECSKMWPIDQLYIELGFNESAKNSINLITSMHIAGIEISLRAFKRIPNIGEIDSKLVGIDDLIQTNNFTKLSGIMSPLFQAKTCAVTPPSSPLYPPQYSAVELRILK